VLFSLTSCQKEDIKPKLKDSEIEKYTPEPIINYTGYLYVKQIKITIHNSGNVYTFDYYPNKMNLGLLKIKNNQITSTFRYISGRLECHSEMFKQQGYTTIYTIDKFKIKTFNWSTTTEFILMPIDEWDDFELLPCNIN
jgi:hypothetical protein